jgi:hypothetical protein
MCAAFRSESTIACGRDSVLDNAETRLRGSNCAIICTLTSESLGDKVLRTLASTFVIIRNQHQVWTVRRHGRNWIAVLVNRAETLRSPI